MQVTNKRTIRPTRLNNSKGCVFGATFPGSSKLGRLALAVLLFAGASTSAIASGPTVVIIHGPIPTPIVIGQQANDPITETYEYDALGRLHKVTRSDGTEVIYNYDAAGNRSSKVVTDSSAP